MILETQAFPPLLRVSCLLAGLTLPGGPAMSADPEILVRAEVPVVEGLAGVGSIPGEADLKGKAAVLVAGAEGWDDAARARLDGFVKNGGGLVLVHDAITASGFVPGEVKRWAGGVPLFFTPAGRQQPVTSGLSNFDVEDEMFHGFPLPDDAEVLATTWTPNRKHLKGTDPQPYVYGVSPVIWTMPHGKGRIVCFVPGKSAATLEHPAIRTLLARALAWAGGKDDIDAFSPDVPEESLTYPKGGPLSPRASVGSLQVHPEFKAVLVAAEPLVSKPLNIDWDGQGRLWVVESLEYPEGKKGGGPESMYDVWQRETELPKPPPVDRLGHDRISWLEDTDGDGVMDKKHVFADDLDLATSFCFYRDGVIVAQPPEILRLRDRDGDGKADQREVLYTGLGTFDTHSVLNNLRWGLDGWIYSTHGYSGSPKVTSGDGKTDFGAIGSGIVRFRPDGSKIEMVSAKSGNCWGFEMTSDGEMFMTQPTSGDLLMHVPVSDRIMAEAGMGRDPSWNVLIHLRPVKPLMSWDEIVENQPNDVIGSFTAACGNAIYEGGSWPGKWTLGYFTAEPTVHIVHHEQLAGEGVTYTAEKTREEEFSATRDFWNRPIDTRIGPDGQLYVIDFYNQAILHNDPRGPIHLWNNQAARPDRDHFFGRIVRYEHKRSKKLPAADLSSLEGQVAALGHPNRDLRLRAQRLIEEGEVKAAAEMLGRATGPAKLHALWIRAAAGVLSIDDLARALEDGDPSVRVTAARVVGAHPGLATPEWVKAVAAKLPAESDPRVRLQLLASLPADTVIPAGVLVGLQAGADERWTRAAIARLARNTPGDVLAAALAADEPDKQSPLVALLFESCAGDAAKLVPMLQALGGAKGQGIAVASLASLQGRPLPDAAEVVSTLESLAAGDNHQLAGMALPLAARFWAPAEVGKKLDLLLPRILTGTPVEPGVLAALAKLPAFTAELVESIESAVVQSEDARQVVLPALFSNGSKAAAGLIIDLLPSLPPAEKAGALEALLGRPESAIALSDALADNRLTVAVAGPQVLNRLASHPDEKVRGHAAPIVERFRGAAEAKSAMIDRLLPQVSAPGDPAAGKQLFAACAVCHVFQGQGTSIGPVLEGIGVHGVETLLTHIVDPNREVEPSYHTWNVSTSDGRTVSGFISRETAGSLFLRNAGGEVEIPRDQVASQTDTGKSLMPEGFDALGPVALRDLISYLRSGEQRFHTLPLGKAATADGSRGVYLSPETAGDRVGLKRYGLVEERGVPFHLQDPATAPGGKNVVVLKGGMDPNAVSRSMPAEVEIPVNVAAGRLHLLGAVAGWGFPAVREQDPLVTISVHYADGSSEDIVLKNGIDIADHVAGVDVPGSARTDLTNHGQVRYLWRDLKKPGQVISKLVLSSPGKAPAPMIAAITLESASKDGVMNDAPQDGGPAVQP
ncbi:PVC-type heme-binding CxxCH protein [Luteolibacter marinus]|uniref:PVC-type heme-binding CxxCH protein n=1 Tax=Luteolibacter marinus TaxID=2776705 RepID=UPI001866FBEC|nr:PVC-type heme-binding CxxCH protein [Luteolibacter marinus]